MRPSTLRWVATIVLFAAPLAGQQATSLDQAIWSFPALRALRSTVTGDSLLAPAFEACRAAALRRQREVTALLRSRADASAGAATDSLRDLATRHEAIPLTQLEAGCLLTAAASLPGLISRPGSLPHLEELVGLLRSGQVTPERKEELRRILAGVGERAGTPDETVLHREMDQRSIRDFLDAYAAREAALRPPPPPPQDPTRGPVLLGMVLPERFPKKWQATGYDVTFTVEASGQLSSVAIAPEIRDSADWRPAIDAFMKYRFAPALDSAGQPARGTYTFRWTPGPPPRKP